MVNSISQAPGEQFLRIEDAALVLGVAPDALRQGIACGLIPLRKDNEGNLRIHQGEVPDQLLSQLEDATPEPTLAAATQLDELLSLREQLRRADVHRQQLERLLAQQGSAISRSHALVEAARGSTEDDAATRRDTAALTAQLHDRDREVSSLSELMQRSVQALERQEQLAQRDTQRLSQTADKAMTLLQRAVLDAEQARAELRQMEGRLQHLEHSNSRLEREIEQRNSVIDGQHGLMDRLVSVSEQSVAGTATRTPVKRTLWQRLFGGGKGI